MLTDRAAALLDTLEHQAQWSLDEITRLRRRLAELEAENVQLRDTLQQRETTLAQAAVPRSAAERGYPLPRRSMPEQRAETRASQGAETTRAELAAKSIAQKQAPQSESQAPLPESATQASPAFSDGETPVRPTATALPDDQPSASGDEWPSPQALLDEWYRRYTDTFFKGHTRPLKVGVHEDLMQREPWPDKLVRRALACYVHLPRYLKAVRIGAERVDLEGQPAGLVTEGEARHARKQLESLQAQQRERDAANKRNPETRKNARLDNKLSELLAKHSRH
ncbi:ProQ/FINO family protein [Halomonas sp. GXIMD04776]|uniref:ProQ/FINO family protein n=1 Tax=Halomonas sp. GXIMD04776 TaxID=3415605 RepID=UPI003CB84EBD